MGGSGGKGEGPIGAFLSSTGNSEKPPSAGSGRSLSALIYYTSRLSNPGSELHKIDVALCILIATEAKNLLRQFIKAMIKEKDGVLEVRCFKTEIV